MSADRSGAGPVQDSAWLAHSGCAELAGFEPSWPDLAQVLLGDGGWDGPWDRVLHREHRQRLRALKKGLRRRAAPARLVLPARDARPQSPPDQFLFACARSSARP